MSHAEKCPLCLGDGEMEVENSTCTCKYDIKKCWGCEGKGWVTIHDAVPHYEPTTYPNPFDQPWFPSTPWTGLATHTFTGDPFTVRTTGTNDLGPFTSGSTTDFTLSENDATMNFTTDTSATGWRWTDEEKDKMK